MVKKSKSCTGGSAANTIYGLAKLGVNTGFIGVVGNDAESKLLLKDFQKIGVDTSQIKIKHKAQTGATFCLIDEEGKRSIYVSPGANNLLSTDDFSLDYVNKADLLHISSFVNNRQFKVLIGLIKQLTSPVKLSFSPGALYAARGIKALTPVLRKTSVLFINDKEMRELTAQEFLSGTETCLKLGCHIVVVTLGKGVRCKNIMATAYIRDADNEYIIEPTNERVATTDTTGAGDAFTAGFLYGLLRKRGLKECGHLGNIVAQFCITGVGARESLPTFTQLAERYRELYSGQL